MDYDTCDKCSFCKRKGKRKEGFMGAGYEYGICDHSGNVVILEPWQEKRISGNGYINHKVSGCRLAYSLEVEK